MRRALGKDGAHFQVRDQLGTGASGQVYAVDDRNLRRTVAVKYMAGAEVPAPDRFADFLNEAQITASLQHPNIPPIHEVDVDARGRLFFMMKRIEGLSLGRELAAAAEGRGSVRIASINAVVAITIGAGNALAFAHPALLVAGRFDQALIAARDQATPLMAMTLSGRSGEFADAGQQHSVEVLMATGQDQEAYERFHDDHFMRMWPRHLLGLEAFKHGDQTRAWQLFATGERPLSMEHPYAA